MKLGLQLYYPLFTDRYYRKWMMLVICTGQALVAKSLDYDRIWHLE
jgi:hypothetical protein